MFLKSDFITKLAIKNEASNCKTSLAKEKEFFIVQSLLVKAFSGKTGQKDGVSSSNALWILKIRK